MTPLPAASVIVLRDAPLEVLMLRRHGGASFMPNAWVFTEFRIPNVSIASVTAQWPRLAAML